jgi:hypothetical protein
MRQGRQVFVFAGRPVAERFDRVIEILLIVVLAFGPVAFGVVHAWSELVVILLAAAISLVFLTKLIFTPGASLVWSWVYIPVGAFLLIAVLQLTPLPSSVVRAISPNTVATKMDLLADLPDSEQLLSSTTLSFYPNATRHDLRLVLAVAAVLVVVINVYRQPRRIRRLLTAIAAIGGTIALLALAQTVVGNGRIYWFGEPADGPWVWIITTEEQLVIGNRQEMLEGGYGTRLPHPTLAKGNDVLGAGEIYIRQGIITEYNAQSGHYIMMHNIRLFDEQSRTVFERVLRGLHIWHHPAFVNKSIE